MKKTVHLLTLALLSSSLLLHAGETKEKQENKNASTNLMKKSECSSSKDSCCETGKKLSLRAPDTAKGTLAINR